MVQWPLLYRQCIGGTVTVPPLVKEMQTGSIYNHISQIFFVFTEPMYWWDWLAVLMVRYKGEYKNCQTSW
jgi:hypothetical protein